MREDGGLGHVLGELPQGVAQLISLDAETFTQIHRSGTVVESEDEETQLTASAARNEARLAQPPTLHFLRSLHISGMVSSSSWDRMMSTASSS